MMFEHMENLERLIDGVSSTIQTLRDEKSQMAEELDVVREVLEEREKELASLVEERTALERRLEALLEKARFSFGFSGNSGEETEHVHGTFPTDGETAQNEDDRSEESPRQGELTDRF